MSSLDEKLYRPLDVTSTRARATREQLGAMAGKLHDEFKNGKLVATRRWPWTGAPPERWVAVDGGKYLEKQDQ